MFGAKLISTSLGIGYIEKGAGTIAALFFCGLWYLVHAGGINTLVTFAGILVLFFIGVWSSSVVEKEWGKDHNRVVIDEGLGMCVSLFLLPVQWKYIAIAFVLFRFFDIVKPLYIKKAEALPSGWGVMADDLLAGICSNLLMQLAVLSHII
jgi:phosphatidylglycerophosphatase A